MKGKTRRISIVVVLGFVLLCGTTAVCLLMLLIGSSTVAGTALLPSGITATINGPFSCSENTATTEVSAGRHVFTFSPTTISIDGAPVWPLDAKVTDVRIEAGYWSASLLVNGQEVRMRK